MNLIINLSGGKDSSAMLHWIMTHYGTDYPVHVVFADTGWEHPGAADWCRSIVAPYNLPLHIVRNPNKDYLSMVERRGMFPSPQYRQCTSDLKRGPIAKWIRNNIRTSPIVNCIGIRADESHKRAKQSPVAVDRALTIKTRRVLRWYPIFDWSTPAVYAYHRAHGIPLHPVYEYLPRYSCRVCIFHSDAQLAAIQQHDPAAIDTIAALETRINHTMKPNGTIHEAIARATKPRSHQLPLFHQGEATCLST